MASSSMAMEVRAQALMRMQISPCTPYPKAQFKMMTVEMTAGVSTPSPRMNPFESPPAVSPSAARSDLKTKPAAEPDSTKPGGYGNERDNDTGRDRGAGATKAAAATAAADLNTKPAAERDSTKSAGDGNERGNDRGRGRGRGAAKAAVASKPDAEPNSTGFVKDGDKNRGRGRGRGRGTAAVPFKRPASKNHDGKKPKKAKSDGNDVVEAGGAGGPELMNGDTKQTS